MKKIAFLFILSLLIVTQVTAQTQNSIVSLPPNFIQFSSTPPYFPSPPIPLPAPDFGLPTPFNYAGLPAEYSHNAMQDKDGNLLFFIVDGIIYDKDGYYMTTMDASTGSGEILIVPDPIDCHIYHIFYDGNLGMTMNLTSNPYYFMLDLNNPSGSISISLANFPGIVNGGNSFVKNMYNQYAASKLRPDNSRLVFVNKFSTVHIFKIDASGLSLLSTYEKNPSFPLGGWKPDDGNRSEMEVIEVISPITSSPAYRIAYSSASNNQTQGVYSNLVINADLDYTTASVILGSEEYTEYLFLNNEEPFVHGLEFSEDGSLLYMLHEPTTTYNSVIDIHTIGSGNNNFSPLTISNPSDYQFSQIELGKDNKLYVIGENPSTGTRLATLSNTNTPNPLNWNSNALAVGYNYVYSNYFTGVSNNMLKLYPIPDQIDGMDYTAHFTSTPECCIAYTSFDVEADKNNQEYTGTATWSPGASNNPFGSASGTVTVRDLLVIKSGANITINNMRFEFDVNAKLIVENGARLTINNTTLTVYSDCGGDALMWKGVEVWGTGTGTFQPAVSGRFVAQNSSVIEHAIEGAVNFKHGTTANNGGIIIATTETKFRNNAKDLVFNAYESKFNGNTQNDQSYFSNVTFITDASLNDPSYNNSITHVTLNEVTGIGFQGCDFENTDLTTYNYISRGRGINAYESKFYVKDRCSSPYYPCTVFDESNFINLTTGIFASNSSNRSQIANISKTNFYNLWRSIYLNNMEFPTVIDNDFDIGASIVLMFPLHSYGLYLDISTGYTVENNRFTTTHNGHVGVYVNNSGTAANEVYRNDFSNLVVGSQAASTNGDNIGNGVGLEFRCNKYVNIEDYDILVSSGMVADDHGNCLTVTGPSNNQFSYTVQYGDFWAATSSVGIPTYRYSPPNGYNLEPRNTYYNPINTATHECVNLPAFNYNNSCPNRQGGGGIVLLSTPLNTLEAAYDSINNLMSQSTKDTTVLKTLQQDLGRVKSQMQRARSYIMQDLLLNSKNSDGKLEVIDFLKQHAAYNTNADEQLLTQLYIATGNIGAAQSNMAQLQNKPNNQQFVEFSNIAIALKQHPKQSKALLADSLLLQQVKDLANQPNENSAVAAARALLVNLGLATYEETIEVVIPTGSKARLANQENESSTSNNDSFVKVFPNPANDNLTISHNLETKNGTISLEIMDVMGRVLLNNTINNTNHQIDISQLASGLYFYNIIQQDKMIQSGKLVVE